MTKKQKGFWGKVKAGLKKAGKKTWEHKGKIMAALITTGAIVAAYNTDWSKVNWEKINPLNYFQEDKLVTQAKGDLTSLKADISKLFPDSKSQQANQLNYKQMMQRAKELEKIISQSGGGKSPSSRKRRASQLDKLEKKLSPQQKTIWGKIKKGLKKGVGKAWEHKGKIMIALVAAGAVYGASKVDWQNLKTDDIIKYFNKKTSNTTDKVEIEVIDVPEIVPKILKAPKKISEKEIKEFTKRFNANQYM
jgi:transcriptional regulator of acetoin/glycerol metabolism